jgi:hypothetical protein
MLRKYFGVKLIISASHSDISRSIYNSLNYSININEGDMQRCASALKAELAISQIQRAMIGFGASVNQSFEGLIQ